MRKRSFLPFNRDVAIFERSLNYFISFYHSSPRFAGSSSQKLIGSWPEVTTEQSGKCDVIREKNSHFEIAGVMVTVCILLSLPCWGQKRQNPPRGAQHSPTLLSGTALGKLLHKEIGIRLPRPSIPRNRDAKTRNAAEHRESASPATVPAA